MSERIGALKIAFVGTSCVGKTTLVEEYTKRGIPGLVITDEAARDYFTRNPAVADRFSMGVQGKIQALALRNEQIAHKSGASRIICDRSVLDAVAYVRSQGDVHGSRQLLERVRFWIPTYQNLLLLDPADIPYRVDSIRQEGEETRQRFHLAFLGLFQEGGINYELLSGTLVQRISRVNQLLKL